MSLFVISIIGGVNGQSRIVQNVRVNYWTAELTTIASNVNALCKFPFGAQIIRLPPKYALGAAWAYSSCTSSLLVVRHRIK